MTRLRYENESLKDHQEEREEEVSYIILVKLFCVNLTSVQMKLQRTEMLQLAERMKILEKEQETDKNIILRQQDIIDNYAGQETRDTGSQDFKGICNDSTITSND